MTVEKSAAARVEQARSQRVFLSLLAVAMLIAGCGLGDVAAPKPGGSGSAAPPPYPGLTWIPGCALTSEEVEAALGRPVSAPQLPEQPPMTPGWLQSCGFVILGGSGADGLGINVFDAELAGPDWLDPVRSGFPNGVDVPGIGDAAFMDDQPRAHDLWAVQGQTQLHIFVYGLDPLTVEQFKALADAAFGRL